MVMGQGRPGGVQPRQRHCNVLQMAVKNALVLLNLTKKATRKRIQNRGAQERKAIDSNKRRREKRNAFHFFSFLFRLSEIILEDKCVS